MSAIQRGEGHPEDGTWCIVCCVAVVGAVAPRCSVDGDGSRLELCDSAAACPVTVVPGEWRRGEREHYNWNHGRHRAYGAVAGDGRARAVARVNAENQFSIRLATAE